MTLSSRPRPEKIHAALDMGALDHLIGYQLRRCALRSQARFAEFMAPLGLAPGLFGVLHLIALNPGRTQIDLAQAAGLDRSTLTLMLDQLSKKSWVERRPGADRRSFNLYITPEGQALWQAALTEVEAHEAEITAPLSADAKIVLLNALKRLAPD